MKHTILTLSIIALTPLCFAKPGEGGKKERKGPPPAHVIEKFDADGDGQLNEAERAEAKAHREARKAEFKSIRDSYDSDGDGILTDAEKEAFRTEMKAKALEKFDANGDGVLSDDEKPAGGKHKKRGGKECKNCQKD